MTQVSISSLMMLNLYLLLANFKRPESEKKKKVKGIVDPAISIW